MIQIRKHIQANIDISSTNRKFYLVAFSVFVAFIFLNFFEPFGLYYDKSISREEVFIELFIAMFIAFIVLLLSQFVVRALFKINRFTPITLFIWFLFEAIFVATSWLILEVIDKDFAGNVLDAWIKNFTAYTLIMFLPYFLYVSYVHVKDVIKILENKNSTKISEGNLEKDITFKDENEIVRLVLQHEDFLFIQSANNYVEVSFLENGVLSKTLLRNSIKKLEAIFTNTLIIRCHRSFIVNTTNIELAKKTSSGFNLKMKQVPNIIIPVSKSYISEFKKFTHKL